MKHPHHVPQRPRQTALEGKRSCCILTTLPLPQASRAPRRKVSPSLQFLQWVKRTSLPSIVGHYAGAAILISPNRDSKRIMGFHHWESVTEKAEGLAITSTCISAD